MTPEDHSAILSLVHVPGRGTEGTPDAVLRHFGTADGKQLGLRLLREAAKDQDSTDVEMALIVCSSFGVTAEHLDALAPLSQTAWHESHENIVLLLDQLRTPAAIAALDHLARWIPEYLDWDENRALARKAIWAIGKTPGTEAAQALQRLAEFDDEIVRDEARKQLDRRAAQPPGRWRT